ncbi:MAG: hypothetical protein ACLFRV_03905 [Acidimicrobiales bacterium]
MPRRSQLDPPEPAPPPNPIGRIDEYRDKYGPTPDDPQPIGFVAERQPNAFPTPVSRPGETARPVYYEGDEYRILNNMTPRQVARVQTRLAAAGMIGPRTSYIPGNPETTRRQFRDLLTAANGMGENWETTLRQLAASASMAGGQGALDSGGGGGGDAPTLPTHTAPNSDDLRHAIRRGLMSQFGTHNHGVDIDTLVAQYQAQDRANFDARVGDSQAGGGGTVEDVQSVETFVADAASEADPEGVGARQFLDGANSFFSMLGGPT